MPLHTCAFWGVVVVKGARSAHFPGSKKRAPGSSHEQRLLPVTIQLVGDLLILAVAARVFGQDALALLRRLAAAGVRAGVSEMSRRPNEGREGR